MTLRSAYLARVRNLRHARAAKKAYSGQGLMRVGYGRLRKGGFLPQLISGLTAAHELVKKIKPFSLAKQIGTEAGLSLPNNKFGRILGSIGDLAIKAGYGRRRRSRRRSYSRR